MSLVSYMRISFGTLVFALYFNFRVSIMEINIKIRTLFQMTCFKQHKNMAVDKNLKVTMNFYNKHCLPAVT